jgi:hypothetical protein
MPGGSKQHRKEQAVAALLSEPTVEAAAVKADVSCRTLKAWLAKDDFRDAYAAARRRVLEDTLGQLQAAAPQAVTTLKECLQAPKHADRIRAKVAILAAGREGQRHRPLLVTLAEAEDHRAAPFAQRQVREFKVGQVADAAAGEQKQREDRPGPNVLPKLDLTEEATDHRPVQALRGKLDPPKLLHLPGRVHRDVALLRQPGEEPPDRDQRPVDGRNRLALLPAQEVAEVADVPGRHPARPEWLLVGGGEPGGELRHVLDDGSPRFRGEVVATQVLAEKGGLVLCDRDAVKNIIARILRGLAPGIGQELDTAGP